MAIQLNVPRILNYRDNVKEDKIFIINEIQTNSSLAKELNTYFKDFLIRYELFDE